MTAKTILQTERLTKRYGSKTALAQVDLAIEPGITGLLGPNGSGKSTLIKSLLGLLKIDGGSAQVLGYSLPKEVREVRERVGYLPEDDCFIAGLTGIESVTFMAQLSGLPRQEALRRSHEVLDFADIAQERYRNVEGYSTGMRQKLKFAQAIVHDPELLILDEPTTGLDPEQRVKMLKKIKNLALNHQKSIVISTHILHDVTTICEKVIIMAGGQVRLVDTLENLSRPTQEGLQLALEPKRTPSVDVPYPDAAALRDQLATHSVQCTVDSRGNLWADGVSAENNKIIWQAAAECDVHVVSMAPAKNSLEEVFFRAVQSAQTASPKPLTSPEPINATA